MIQCLLVDDEPLALEVLEKFVQETPGLALMGKCRNAFEASEQLLKATPDLMFLDIEMPLVTGIHFLQSLKERPKTILATAYKEWAYEGYELDVVDYLLKPISYDRFIKAIHKYKEWAPAQPAAHGDEKYLLIKERRGTIRLHQREVLYVEGCKDYVKVVTAKKAYLMLQTMKETVAMLGENFVRVHRSYIVALEQVQLILPERLILKDNTPIPIGDSYKTALLEKLKH